MAQRFERLLSALGFMIDAVENNYHLSHKSCTGKNNCFIFIQDWYEDYYPGIKNVYIAWTKGYTCDVCLDIRVKAILNKGDYTNIKIFKNNKDITSDFVLEKGDLDPDRRYSPEEAEEKETENSTIESEKKEMENIEIEGCNMSYERSESGISYSDEIPPLITNESDIETEEE